MVKGIPVLCGASFKNKGVQFLLDAVIDYLPSPLDVPSPWELILIPGKKKTVKQAMKKLFPGFFLR